MPQSHLNEIKAELEKKAELFTKAVFVDSFQRLLQEILKIRETGLSDLRNGYQTLHDKIPNLDTPQIVEATRRHEEEKPTVPISLSR